jgi:poly-beta-hydroxybutyrate-responsive repressor
MDDSTSHQPSETDLGRMPKNFLSSWLLLLLRNWSAHGYQLMQTLTIAGLGAIDPATVYRTLRQLEKEGLVSSSWDPKDTGAPRRVYTLTEAGEAYLQIWARQLEHYQTVLDRFFELYKAQTTQGKETS